MPVRVSPHTLSRELEGKTILLNLSSGQYYRLNETGTILWNCLLQGQGIEQAVEQITQEYDVSPEQARTDLDQVLAELIAAGLCEEIPS